MEIEIKILEVDRNAIEKRLKDIGAEHISSEELHAIYYKGPGGAEARVREEGGAVILCTKREVQSEEAKIRDEVEITLPSFAIAERLMLTLGFEPIEETTKYRITYEKDNVRYMLDKYLKRYDAIPLFLEIEGSNVNEVYEALTELGFNKEDAKPWTRKQLFKHYNR